MKNKFQKLSIIIFSLCVLIGCNNESIMKNNNASTQPKESQLVSIVSTDENNAETITNRSSTTQLKESQIVSTMNTDESSTEDTINKFFFQDISIKNQYDYEGSIWGNAIHANKIVEGLSEPVEKGELPVKATLTVTEVAPLTKGKIYELKFVILGEEVDPSFKETKLYLWVTNEAIYYFSPPDNFDYKEFVIDNRFDDLAYAKMLEETGQLPSDEETLIRCYDTNMNIQDDPGETQILIENDICTYNTHHNSGHFTKYEWKIDEGLVYYASGYGAAREGMRLRLVK